MQHKIFNFIQSFSNFLPLADHRDTSPLLDGMIKSFCYQLEEMIGLSYFSRQSENIWEKREILFNFLGVGRK